MTIQRRTVKCENCGSQTTVGWHIKVRKNCGKCHKVFPDNQVDILVKKYL